MANPCYVSVELKPDFPEPIFLKDLFQQWIVKELGHDDGDAVFDWCWRETEPVSELVFYY